MTRRHWAHIIAVAAVVAALAAAAPAAAGAAAAGDQTDAAAGGASAAATAYLQARADAVASTDPAVVLAPFVVGSSKLADREAKVARGTALRGRAIGRSVRSASCEVTIICMQASGDGLTASVDARAVTSITWETSAGTTDLEASGIDHVLKLERNGDRWLVTGDACDDVLRSACLEAAGASRLRVRAAARAVERSSGPVRLPATAARRSVPTRRYTAVVKYDRPAAQAYADARALSYNSTFVRFAGADCANFASQCARAGSMPQTPGSTTSGWWYDKDGSSSPSDDTYSLSWINVTRQMSYWNQRRTDWETSAGRLSRGDFIYYDWTGDGVWDHVAVVAGTNSAGQKIIDAHTTDHYHVYWKLGSSSTKYKYARVRVSWVI